MSHDLLVLFASRYGLIEICMSDFELTLKRIDFVYTRAPVEPAITMENLLSAVSSCYWYQLLTAHCYAFGCYDMNRCSFAQIMSNRMPRHGNPVNIRYLLTMLWCWSRVHNHKCHSELNREAIFSDTLFALRTGLRDWLRFDLFTAAKRIELMKTAPAICAATVNQTSLSPSLSGF